MAQSVGQPLRFRNLLRASRVCTPGLFSTATLPSVIRGGYNKSNNYNYNYNYNYYYYYHNYRYSCLGFRRRV